MICYQRPVQVEVLHGWKHVTAGVGVNVDISQLTIACLSPVKLSWHRKVNLHGVVTIADVAHNNRNAAAVSNASSKSA